MHSWVGVGRAFLPKAPDLTLPSPAEHQSWRLTGGTDPCEGQVEVYYRGVWNTVCDSSWYEPEAKVLCQDLGCGTVARRPKGPPHSLSGKMYYSCEGGEAALSECFWRFNNSNLCRESRAARVLCSGTLRPPHPTPPPPDLDQELHLYPQPQNL